MKTNFDFLKEEPKFKDFADVAISAEKVFLLDSDACIMHCRRAMEIAVKWLYSVEEELKKPYQDNLQSLIKSVEFRNIVGEDLLKRMDYIRRCGNNVAHGNEKMSKDAAMLCLENLFIFMDFVSCCYADKYEQRDFNKEYINERIKKVKKNRAEYEAMKAELQKELQNIAQKDLDLEKLRKENESLKAVLSARRIENQENYIPRPLELTEYSTRKLYIDEMLRDAGWVEGKDWFNEVKLNGMPNQSETGYADYVLYDDMHMPLAVVEAKRTCVDVVKGRQQAKLYADIVEKEFGRRPVVFLTNGFETRMIDNQYPERKIAGIYSKRDLEKLFNLQHMRTSLKYVNVDKNIAGRYYQEAAVKAVCESFDQDNRRKALLVMATGSGKTRTVIALCKVLLEAGWIKNVLFLADRTSLVTQAKRSFVNMLPDLSCTNLCEDKDNTNAHCVFSTYQTMISCVDNIMDDEGKIFTIGHFDLVICDEAHRSIYNKYKDILNYFDAPLVGLTATPKDEIDKNTYSIFGLENGVPTYGYELAQAVKDGFLVDYVSVETKLKFIEEGITYADLSEEEKREYEETFEDEEVLPLKIDSSALNTWLFNEDTIKQVLHIVMTNGLKIQYGEKIGKTIIFAKNHLHAEKIMEIFNKEYPNLSKGTNGQPFVKVIDNQTTYSQSAIDEFSNPNGLPQIAISVDMLDTGIDVPEVLNLVFFKKVMSKAKFWQMIGRGTRLCHGLMDGEDKSQFYIFDFCGNFEFFRMSKGRPTTNMIALQSAIFNLEFQMTYKLQDLNYQTNQLITFRNELVDTMVNKVKEIKRDNFAVRQHIKYVDKYAKKENYQSITFEDTLQVREELSPYIQPDDDEATAVRFDALVFGLELAQLAGKKYGRLKSDLYKKVEAISSVANIPEILAQKELISQVLEDGYIDRAGIDDFEKIRINLRNLMKYLPTDRKRRYDTNFTDNILDMSWNDSELENDDLKNYKAKAEFCIMQHINDEAIKKIKTNQPLDQDDLESLEHILWNEAGTKEDYRHEYGEKPLGAFVRSIVGLDMNVAKKAFSDFLDGKRMNSRQIYFVNQIVEYIVHNGMMTDFAVLQESPFTDQGSVVDIFDDTSVWMSIRNVIEQINYNAVI